MFEIVRAAVVIVAFTFLVTFINCTFLMTIRENSYDRKDPPNVMQWQLGWDCACDVWRGYLNL